jgi:hypothetical protein
MFTSEADYIINHPDRITSSGIPEANPRGAGTAQRTDDDQIDDMVDLAWMLV